MDIAGLVAARRDPPRCQTPEEHVNAVKSMCERLVGAQIENAWPDDWGRHSNFAVIIRPRTAERLTTRVVRALVRRALPSGAHIRAIYPPERARGRLGRRAARRRLEWKVDVDFHAYDAGTNTFDIEEPSAGRERELK